MTLFSIDGNGAAVEASVSRSLMPLLFWMDPPGATAIIVIVVC